MTRRRPHIPLRTPIYIGCEGASESNYAAVLRDLARDRDLPVHLTIEELAPGAGDPLARLTLAVQRIANMRSKRISPVASFAFLDEDQAVREPLARAIWPRKRESRSSGNARVSKRCCFAICPIARPIGLLTRKER